MAGGLRRKAMSGAYSRQITPISRSILRDREQQSESETPAQADDAGGSASSERRTPEIRATRRGRR